MKVKWSAKPRPSRGEFKSGSTGPVTKVPLSCFHKIRDMVWAGRTEGIIRACFPWIAEEALYKAIGRAQSGMLRPAVRKQITALAASGEREEEIAAKCHVTPAQVRWTLQFWEREG